jgi:hypothetical protein
MGLTATTVEIRSGKVSDLVAEHLAQHRDRRAGKFHGQADHTAIEMDPTKRPPKPTAPLDLHARPEVGESPTVSPVLEKAVDVHAESPATDRFHVQDATMPRVWRSMPGSCRHLWQWGRGSSGFCGQRPPAAATAC